MALAHSERRRLLEAEIPQSNEVRQLLHDFLRRSGLTMQDFAHRINYSKSSLSLFMNNSYQKVSANEGPIRDSIVKFIYQNPILNSDGADGDSKLYRTTNVKVMERYMQKALQQSRAYVVYGPPGTQKSFVAERLVQELRTREIGKNGHGMRAGYVYVRAEIRPSDLMKRVAESFGTPSNGNVDQIMRNFRYELRGRRSVLILDEAQHLSNTCLEVIRELLDRPPYCGILILGSHNLKRIFDQVELEQWNQRVRAGKILPGISDEEAKNIIAGELGAQPAKKVEGLIDSARVSDPRQGQDFRYISARKLFWSLGDIKEALTEKGADA